MQLNGGGWTLVMRTGSSSVGAYTYDHAVWTAQSANGSPAPLDTTAGTGSDVSEAFYDLKGHQVSSAVCAPVARRRSIFILTDDAPV
jgi:hypothetical protein